MINFKKYNYIKKNVCDLKCKFQKTNSYKLNNIIILNFNTIAYKCRSKYYMFYQRRHKIDIIMRKNRKNYIKKKKSLFCFQLSKITIKKALSNVQQF